MEAARGNRDALEHDAALAALGQEGGRISGEDEEFAAELREAMLEEERHLSSDHFRESLVEEKWCSHLLHPPLICGGRHAHVTGAWLSYPCWSACSRQCSMCSPLEGVLSPQK